MNKCLQCNKEYKPIKHNQQYCGVNCRVTANRRKNVTAETVTATRLPETANKTLRNETTTTDKTQNKVECPITEHRADCLKCSHLKRKDKIGDNENCGESYFKCTKWGVVIESYHEKMCLLT